jgi:aspartate/tyrosine/aromatic aminotransferase
MLMRDKLLSGRFWLTIITGIVFAYAVWKRILNAEATATIITMVFIAYFQRQDRGQNDRQKPA